MLLRSLRSMLSRPIRAAPDAIGEAPNDVLAFEQIAGETHLAALQTAAVMSCINALRNVGRLKDPLAIEDLAPRPPALTFGLSRDQIAATCELAAKEFFSGLPAARRELRAFCTDGEQFGVELAAFLHLERLSAVWRKVSGHALKAVHALDPDLQRCLPERYHQNTLVLVKLVRSAIDGGEPCIDDNGHCFLPDLPQRRPATRRNIYLPCMLEHQGKTSRAVVKDISTGGIGLERACQLTVQNVIVVELEGGRCLAGTVVWSRNKSAGIKFDAPLKSTDPLLIG